MESAAWIWAKMADLLKESRPALKLNSSGKGSCEAGGSGTYCM